MLPVKQTVLHNPPESIGNCFPAVIASILEVSIDEVLPVEKMFNEADWNVRLFCWLKDRGWLWRGAPEFDLFYAQGKCPDYLKLEWVRDVPYIVTGKTLRFEGKVNHVCIYVNGEMVHDPHPDNTGLITMEFFEVIERIN